MATYDSPYTPPPRRQPGSPWLVVVFLLCLLLLPLGALAWWYWSGSHGGLDPNAEPRTVTPRGDLADEEKSTIALFRKVGPSVVHISSLNARQTEYGTGSGFVWDKEGRVVTNFHVIQDAATAVVVLSDHSTWRAQLVGGSQEKDLAVLSIGAPKGKLQPIDLGTSHDLQVGQNAFAIGNPFGLDQSLTKGIISALGRELKSDSPRPLKNVIQTDAAVNPGNSGGPLLDSAGRLIGVNTAIYSPSGANAGIGFAIPVDEVNRAVTQLIQHGRIVRPGLGVVSAEDEIARRFNVRDGALIWRIAPGSAAAKAGLHETYRDADTGEIEMGDVVVALNGNAIHSGKDMYSAFDNYKVGDTVTVTILRKGKKQDVQATLEPIG